MSKTNRPPGAVSVGKCHWLAIVAAINAVVPTKEKSAVAATPFNQSQLRIERTVTHCDVVMGGFPCQAFTFLAPLASEAVVACP